MHKLTCEQVLGLLSFYVEKKLSPNLMKEVEYHLNVCKSCKTEYFNLINILNNCNEKNSQIAISDINNDDGYSKLQYKVFMDNLSAYIDNELDDDENIKIKKISIINQNARQELENMLYFRYLLQSAFDMTKLRLKKDYSAEIVNSLYNTKKKNKFLLSINYSFLLIILLYLLIFLKIIHN